MMLAHARNSAMSYIGEDASPTLDIVFTLFCLFLALTFVYWLVKGFIAILRSLFGLAAAHLWRREEAERPMLAEPSPVPKVERPAAQTREFDPEEDDRRSERQNWVQIPAWLARTHPLFGVRGWISKYLLWFFIVGSAYALAALINLRLAARVPAEPQAATAVGAAIGAAGLGAAAIMVGVLGLFRLRIFPISAMVFTAAATVATTTFGLLLYRHFLPWLSPEQLFSFGAMAVGTVVPLWLGVAQMPRSTGFRITYWNQLRSDHPALTGPTIAGLRQLGGLVELRPDAIMPLREARGAARQSTADDGPHDELVKVRSQLWDLQRLRQQGQISPEEQRERQAMLLDRLTQDARQLVIQAIGSGKSNQPSLGPAE